MEEKPKNPYVKSRLGTKIGSIHVLKKDKCPDHIKGARRKLSFYLCKCEVCKTEKIWGSDQIRNLKDWFAPGLIDCPQCLKVRKLQLKEKRRTYKNIKKEISKNSQIERMKEKIISLEREINESKEKLENLLKSRNDPNRTS